MYKSLILLALLCLPAVAFATDPELIRHECAQEQEAQPPVPLSESACLAGVLTTLQEGDLWTFMGMCLDLDQPARLRYERERVLNELNLDVKEEVDRARLRVIAHLEDELRQAHWLRRLFPALPRESRDLQLLTNLLPESLDEDYSDMGGLMRFIIEQWHYEMYFADTARFGPECHLPAYSTVK